MRRVRWGLVIGLVALHLVMKAPVWFLIGRMSVFDGSTGYFRARLIDATIHNFGVWWLMGTQATDKWGPGLFDITNEYILQGVNGGLLTMLLFVLIIARAFGTVGRTVRAYKNSPKYIKIAAWAAGCALLAHAATYFSVSYFDQNIVTWFLLLAVISNGPTFARRETRRQLTTSAGTLYETNDVPSSGWNSPLCAHDLQVAGEITRCGSEF